MISVLPQLYKITAIGPVSSKQLEDRSAAITKILQEKELDFLLNCVRLYLDKPILNKEFKREFIKAFNDIDSTFLDGSDLENSILSQAVILELLKENTKETAIVSMGLITGSLGVRREKLLSFEVLQKALDFLNSSAQEVRQPKQLTNTAGKMPQIKDNPGTILEVTEHIKALNKYVKDALNQLEQQKSIYEKRFEIIEEESNIHWWLFRGYSNLNDVPLKDLAPKEAPLVIALDLKKLFKKLPLPLNAKDFLYKALKEIPELPEKYYLKEVIETIISLYKDSLNLTNMNTYGNLAPISFALSKAEEPGLEESWNSVFEKQSGLSINHAFSPLDLASQILNELSLIKI